MGKIIVIAMFMFLLKSIKIVLNGGILKYKFLLIKYKGRYESNTSYFFLRTCNYNYNEIYIYHGCILYKVEIIFPQSILHYQLFAYLRETLYAGCVKLFDKASRSLHARCISVRRRPQNGVLEVHPSGGQNMEVGGC
jgi:hypothetical protein